jgi:hypothetical protein
MLQNVVILEHFSRSFVVLHRVFPVRKGPKSFEAARLEFRPVYAISLQVQRVVSYDGEEVPIAINAVT